MLKRIYIDNFRSLVNFDLVVDSINLFLGPNGSGKSTVFEVLRKIHAFVNGGDKTTDVFKKVDITRWQASQIQKFELEVEGNGGMYRYELAIEHEEGRQSGQPVRVYYEHLKFNDNPLFDLGFPPRGDHSRLLDAAQLYNDDHSKSQVLPISRDRSTIAWLPSHDQNTRLSWFRERIGRFIIVQVNPILMAGDSPQEKVILAAKAENFVSWYRYIHQNRKDKEAEIVKVLQEILDGFKEFKFIKVGEQHRFLALSFSGKKNGRRNPEYLFTELSDGQRALIALYSLVYYAQSEDYTLCIDEPENFLALSEIQPWLTLLYDFCSDGKLQALLISHHPELIDYLASSAGYWFDYQINTPVQIKRITQEDQEGVPISELVARGWLHG